MSSRLDAGSDNDRPWEQPGAVRRDVPPHRGPLLYGLSMLGFCLSIFLCFFPLPGLVLNVTVSLVARRDLAAMAAGRMDADGEGYCKAAISRSDMGIAVCVATVLYVAALFIGMQVFTR